MIERPLTFRGNGEELVGVLTVPDSDPTEVEVAIVFAQSGARGRLGNSFHYPYFARRFAAADIASFRFDPAGLGDSTGAIAPGDVRDLYASIAAGRFVPDTLAAIQELARHVRARRLYLLGVCGGAATALLAAAASTSRVDGVALLSLPVLLDSAARIPKRYAREYLLKNYASKILSPRAWNRLLTGQSQTKRILTHALASMSSFQFSTERHPHPMFNVRVVRAIDALVKHRRRVLVVYGQDDYFRHQWEAEFRDVYWNVKPEYRTALHVEYVAGGNHMFSLRESQSAITDRVSLWLRATQEPALDSHD
jgi:alpha-beta hydrolase superfamily lysophospholipase